MKIPRAVAAVAAGVIIGGGVTVVTPAGAEVEQFAATNWKKIWKKKLKPQADKRYYTKSASDVKYSTKAEVGAAFANYYTKAQTDAALGGFYTKAQTDAALSGYYTKAQADAKYQPVGSYAAAGSSYTTTESDAKYVAKPVLIKGAWGTSASTNGGGVLESPISFGVTLAAPPTAHFIPFGSPPPAACPGNLAAPDAIAGHLCVYEQSASGVGGRLLCNLNGVCAGAVASFGTEVFAIEAGGAASRWMRGTWALRPGGAATVTTGMTSGAAAEVTTGPDGGMRIER